jgi:hypothetical protein
MQQYYVIGDRNLPFFVALGVRLGLRMTIGAHMTFDFQTILAALLAGSVLSLAISQVFRLLQENIDLEKDHASKALVISLMILAGPHILAAAAGKLRRLGEWPTEYVLGIYAVSAIWAGLLGFCVLAMLFS